MTYKLEKDVNNFKFYENVKRPYKFRRVINNAQIAFIAMYRFGGDSLHTSVNRNSRGWDDLYGDKGKLLPSWQAWQIEFALLFVVAS